MVPFFSSNLVMWEQGAGAGTAIPSPRSQGGTWPGQLSAASSSGGCVRTGRGKGSAARFVQAILS